MFAEPLSGCHARSSSRSAVLLGLVPTSACAWHCPDTAAQGFLQNECEHCTVGSDLPQAVSWLT